MSRSVEELVRFGQSRNLMKPTPLLMWASTTSAGTRTDSPQESGASPPTRIGAGSAVLYKGVMQLLNVKRGIRWVSVMLDGSM